MESISVQHSNVPSTKTNEEQSLEEQIQASTNLPKTFYGRKMESDEIRLVEQITLQIKARNLQLPFHWTMGDTLRFLALCKNDQAETIKTIETHLGWLTHIATNYELTETAADQMKNGHIYLAGRSRQGLPILVISIGDMKFNQKLAPHAENALIFVLMTLKKYMMLGGYVESYHVFMDFNGKGPMGISMAFVKSVIAAIQTNFCHRGGTTFIYNASWGFNMTWNIIKAFQSEENLAYTKFIKKGEEQIILDHVYPEKWERRFGGEMENYTLGEYWPPKNFESGDESDILNKEEIILNRYHVFWIINEKLDTDCWTFEGDSTQAEYNDEMYEERLCVHEDMLKPQEHDLEISEVKSQKKKVSFADDYDCNREKANMGIKKNQNDSPAKTEKDTNNPYENTPSNIEVESRFEEKGAPMECEGYYDDYLAKRSGVLKCFCRWFCCRKAG